MNAINIVHVQNNMFATYFITIDTAQTLLFPMLIFHYLTIYDKHEEMAVNRFEMRVLTSFAPTVTPYRQQSKKRGALNYLLEFAGI